MDRYRLFKRKEPPECKERRFARAGGSRKRRKRKPGKSVGLASSSGTRSLPQQNKSLDLFSRLPNDVFAHILSFLSIKAFTNLSVTSKASIARCRSPELLRALPSPFDYAWRRSLSRVASETADANEKVTNMWINIDQLGRYIATVSVVDVEFRGDSDRDRGQFNTWARCDIRCAVTGAKLVSRSMKTSVLYSVNFTINPSTSESMALICDPNGRVELFNLSRGPQVIRTVTADIFQSKEVALELCYRRQSNGIYKLLIVGGDGGISEADLPLPPDTRGCVVGLWELDSPHDPLVLDQGYTCRSVQGNAKSDWCAIAQSGSTRPLYLRSIHNPICAPEKDWVDVYALGSQPTFLGRIFQCNAVAVAPRGLSCADIVVLHRRQENAGAQSRSLLVTGAKELPRMCIKKKTGPLHGCLQWNDGHLQRFYGKGWKTWEGEVRELTVSIRSSDGRAQVLLLDHDCVITARNFGSDLGFGFPEGQAVDLEADWVLDGIDPPLLHRDIMGYSANPWRPICLTVSPLGNFAVGVYARRTGWGGKWTKDTDLCYYLVVHEMEFGEKLAVMRM